MRRVASSRPINILLAAALGGLSMAADKPSELSGFLRDLQPGQTVEVLDGAYTTQGCRTGEGLIHARP